jgi:hypothetical protein
MNRRGDVLPGGELLLTFQPIEEQDDEFCVLPRNREQRMALAGNILLKEMEIEEIETENEFADLMEFLEARHDTHHHRTNTATSTESTGTRIQIHRNNNNATHRNTTAGPSVSNHCGASVQYTQEEIEISALQREMTLLPTAINPLNHDDGNLGDGLEDLEEEGEDEEEGGEGKRNQGDGTNLEELEEGKASGNGTGGIGTPNSIHNDAEDIPELAGARRQTSTSQMSISMGDRLGLRIVTHGNSKNSGTGGQSGMKHVIPQRLGHWTDEERKELGILPKEPKKTRVIKVQVIIKADLKIDFIPDWIFNLSMRSTISMLIPMLEHQALLFAPNGLLENVLAEKEEIYQIVTAKIAEYKERMLKQQEIEDAEGEEKHQ